VPVQIKGIDHVRNALNDSGSEIKLIRHRSRVQQLTQLPSRGRVKIKGIVGPAVEIDIVMLDASPVATETNCVNIAPPWSKLFAVCDDLNEPVNLTADTVHRLSTLKSYKSVVIPEPAETVVNQTCENDETVAQNESVMEKRYEIDCQSADTITLINERKAEPAFVKYFDKARHGHKQLFIRSNLLYRRGKVNGYPVEQLCLS
jgi:hypothetical protein